MLSKFIKICIILILSCCFTLSRELKETIEKSNVLKENFNEINAEEIVSEEELTDNSEIIDDSILRNLGSRSQKYNSVNARSNSYNPNSTKFNPTSLNNIGGKTAQASHQKASQIWKELRGNDLPAAPPAHRMLESENKELLFLNDNYS